MSGKELIIEGPRRNNPINILRTLAVFVLFLFFLISFLQRNVYNNDFWWHLATGKYITENRALPQNDPFSYTSSETQSTRRTTVLKGYWLAQVFFYKVYSLWEEQGIIFLRALLMLMFLFFIFLTIKKQGASDLLALLLVAGVFIFSRGSLGERPQLFTFFFFSVVMYLLEDFRATKSKKIFLVPVCVLFLSNMHPGYIVCILLISLYVAGAVLTSVFGKDPGNSDAKTLSLVLVLTMSASLLNPNGPAIFKLFFFPVRRIEGIVEFMSPLTLYMNKMLPLDYSYIIFLLLSLFSLRYFKKIGVVHLFVLAVFTIMSFVAIRYVIYYMCVSAPILAKIILNIKEERGLKGRLKFLSGKEIILYLIAFIAGLSLVFNTLPAMARYEFKADTSFSVPKEASDFLSNIKIRGNMFNEYGFGGYLIWRLYPDKKVFIDGRALEPDVYDEYNLLAYAITAGSRSYEDIIGKNNITYVIMPPLNPRGDIYPLVESLLDRDDWGLIYSDRLSLIFLKKDNQNKDIFHFAVDKQEGLKTIIIQASARAMRNKANPYYLITLGKVFYKLDRPDDAQKAFLVASRLAPDNIMIKEWLQRLKENKKQPQEAGLPGSP